MSLPIIISILILTVAAILLRVFRKRIISWLLKMRMKNTFLTLRTAIDSADKNKRNTGRKNMVVLNTDTNQFEAVQKKQLKRLAKKRVQDTVPAGFRQMPARKASSLTLTKVKTVERKTPYSTN